MNEEDKRFEKYLNNALKDAYYKVSGGVKIGAVLFDELFYDHAELANSIIDTCLDPSECDDMDDEKITNFLNYVRNKLKYN